MPTCIAPGCQDPIRSASFSNLCRRHATAKYRHGHPLQTYVTPRHLTPHRRTIARLRRHNADSPLWSELRTAWARIVDHCRGVLVDHKTGTARGRHAVQAAETVLHLDATAGPDKCINEGLAVVMLYAACGTVGHPRLYRDLRCAQFDLVRKILHLSPQSKGSFWDHRKQRVTTVFRNPVPRMVDLLAAIRWPMLALAGGMIFEHEQRKKLAPQEGRATVIQAIEELK